MDAPSLSLSLARYLIQKPFIVKDLEAASLFALDAMANAVAGRNSDQGRILLNWSEQHGKLFESDTGRAAFILAALTHIMEVDDLHRASVVHPGCVVIPAAFAVARACKFKGKAFLLAVLRGFEAATRVGMAVGPSHYKVWHNTATCGTFGSAAAVASLLECDDIQTMHALGNAGSQSSGLWEFLDTGAMTKHLHAGHAAQAGVLAGELAALGFTGPPKIFEGARGFFAATCVDADPEMLLKDQEAPWQLHLTSLKPWPSCRHAHPAIECAKELRAKLKARGLKIENIERVSVQTYQAALNRCDRPKPTTDYEAKFSLQHCVAAGLSFEEIAFDAFNAQSRSALGPLAAKVSLEITPEFEKAYPISWGSQVTLYIRGENAALIARRQGAKGDPEFPLTREEIVSKAEGLMAHGGLSNPKSLISAILALPDDGALPDLPPV